MTRPVCWQPGRWLFAFYPFVLRWLPSRERHPDGGWTVWWLWFEVARA
jgi:hypothetical protein